MYNLYSINDINRILDKHNFSFSKSLGQNFLIDSNICPKIVSMSGINSSSGVIEIGPGMGVLTREISKIAKKVISVEIDKRLLSILDETLVDLDNVSIINDDILNVDILKLIDEKFNDIKEIHICANLPYYITTPILMNILEQRLPISSITVMVQKELGQRICADFGKRESSSIGFAVNYYSNPKILFNVSRGSFIPSPKVDSCVVQLNLIKDKLYDIYDEKFLFKLVRAGFNQRRKKLINSISNNLDIPKEFLIESFSFLGINLNIRPENMTIENFVHLSNKLIKK